MAAALPAPDAFCNAFWGRDQAGVPVMQKALLSTSQQTFGDLGSLLASRAALEEQYAQGLEQLAVHALGQGEIDAVLAPLRTFLGEMGKSAKAHAQLASSLKEEVDSQLGPAQRSAHKVWRNKWAALVRLKQRRATEEKAAAAAQVQYETDALQVEGYERQAANADGHDRQRILDKKRSAQTSLVASRKAYAAAVSQARDTAQRWTREWKDFCDLMQDLEEKRLDQLQSSLWNYANAVSGVCVSDDEGCEALRQALEASTVEETTQQFINTRGTGREMDPPIQFYEFPQRPPANVEPHIANFAREHPDPEQEANSVLDHTPDLSALSLSPRPPASPSGSTHPSPTLAQPDKSTAATASPRTAAAVASPHVAAAVSSPRTTPVATTSATAPMTPAKPSSPAMQAPLPAVSPFSNVSKRAMKEVQATNAQPVKPLELSPKPPSWPAAERSKLSTSDAPSKAPSMRSNKSVFSGKGGEYQDPIEAALKRLQDKQARTPRSASRSTFSPSPTSPERERRAVSPVPTFPSTPGPQPVAALMQGPSAPATHSPSRDGHASTSTPGLDPGNVSIVEAALPGERRSSFNAGAHEAAPADHMMRSPSIAPGSIAPMSPGSATGFAGVGARGRSPSPAPFTPMLGSPQTQTFVQPTFTPSHRPVSPDGRPKSPLGISLNKSGKVVQDDLADQFRREHPPPPSPQPSSQWSAPAQAATPAPAPTAAPAQAAPPQWQGTFPTSPAPGWAPPAGPWGGFMRPVTPTGQPYPATPQTQAQPLQAAPPGPAQTRAPSPAPPPGSGPQGTAYPSYQRPMTPSQPVPVQRPGSAVPYGGYYSYPYGYAMPPAPGASAPGAQAGPAPPPPNAQGYPYYPPPQPYGAPAPYFYGQPPVPVPTPAPQAQAQAQAPQAQAPQAQAQVQAQAQAQAQGQAQAQARGAQTAPPGAAGPYPAQVSSGKPVVRVVKAMYDYNAQLPEEFSFRAGDLLLVSEMNEDGWWEGEHLDPGKKAQMQLSPEAVIFPSNFTTSV